MQRAQLDTQQLLAFLAVAETGSFSAAARQLHITQPAISKRIAQFEHALGYALFERVSRKVILTDEGSRLLSPARAIRQSVDAFIDMVADRDGALQGRLSVALSHYVGLHLLPKALSSFSSVHRQVLLDLSFMDSEAAIEAVRHGEVSLAYATLPHRMGEGIVAKPLWQERLVPLAATHVIRGAGEKNSMELTELGKRLPIILPASNTSTRQAVDHWLDQVGILPPSVIEVNQLDSVAQLSLTGVGWSILPETFRSERLEMLPIDSQIPFPGRTLGLVYREGQVFSRLAKAFIQTVESGL